MTYQLGTKVGTFIIRPHRTVPSSVELWVGSECYGSYASARMAASDVASHATGYHQWDAASHLEASEDLGDWQQG